MPTMRGCYQQIADCAKRILRYDAVIVDDIGYVQQSRQEMEVLFTFLADRYERGSVILELNIESYRMEVAKKYEQKKPDGPAKGSK